MSHAMGERRFKRGFDWLSAIPLLVIFSPFFAILSLLVALDGGPILFAHRRVGQAGKVFGCYKFRTMFVGADECLNEYLGLHPEAAIVWGRDQKLDFDPRITGIGKLLRKTSLDELPQLMNVIRGEMSLVGPRPVTESELTRYGHHARTYMSIRPGLTGLWQVSGRNRLTYAERVSLDMQYVATQSIWHDLMILGKTISVLLTGDGR